MVQRITIQLSQFSADGSSILLQSEQMHYLTRVLRLKEGNRFIAQDGYGNQWLAALDQTSYDQRSYDQRPSNQPSYLNQTQARVLEKLPLAPAVTSDMRLIAALPKGNGFDNVVRQTTELGVTHIHPVITARTLLKPSSNKRARWKRIAQEASEQSERVTVPEIAEPAAFEDCLEGLKLTHEEEMRSLRFICAARANNTSEHVQSANAKSSNNNLLLSHLLTAHQNISPSAQLPSVTIAIGPEGGWTTDEITVASSYGYEVVSLGSVILRAVTAPITALSLVVGARDLLI